MPKLTSSVVSELLNSSEQFPVKLADAASWLGFGYLEHAINSFENFKFLNGIDYDQQPGYFRLSVDCLKTWCLCSNTPEAAKVRKRFLEAENGRSSTPPKRWLSAYEKAINLTYPTQLVDLHRAALETYVEEKGSLDYIHNKYCIDRPVKIYYDCGELTSAVMQYMGTLT